MTIIRESKQKSGGGGGVREKTGRGGEEREVWRAEEGGMVKQRGFVQTRMSKTVLTKKTGGVGVCVVILEVEQAQVSEGYFSH